MSGTEREEEGKKRILFYERNYKLRSSGDGNKPCEASPECNVSHAQPASLSCDIKSNYVAAQLNRK